MPDHPSIVINSSTFEEVLPFWKNELWPGRHSAITDYSIIDHHGHLSLDKSTLSCFFVKATLEDGQIVGVNSGIKTSDSHFRSRGIWVHPEFRGLHIGSGLISELEKIAKTLDCKIIWSMPRHTSIQFYQKNGFETYKQTSAYEFGPHYLVQKSLSS